MKNINKWVLNGGKLIIYDAGCPDVDISYVGGQASLNYLFLDPAFVTTKEHITDQEYNIGVKIVEENILSSKNKNNDSYINTKIFTKLPNFSAEHINNFLLSKNKNTYCVDIEYEYFKIKHTMQAYSAPKKAGKGLIIYNGIIRDGLSDGSPAFQGRPATDPMADTMQGYRAKMLLNNLNQMWHNMGGDHSKCGLPCNAYASIYDESNTSFESGDIKKIKINKDFKDSIKISILNNEKMQSTLYLDNIPIEGNELKTWFIINTKERINDRDGHIVVYPHKKVASNKFEYYFNTFKLAEGYCVKAVLQIATDTYLSKEKCYNE